MSTWWILEAACRGHDPEIFFPSTSAEVVKHLDTAQQICGTCIVQAECLDYAQVNKFDEGIWGGLSANQRRRIRRKVK
jgi:WhiB family redox-sensing transcriptional regulator